MPNALDLVIASALVIAFIGGWQLGFVTRATSWLGLVTGLLIGARMLPWIVDRLGGAPPGRVVLTMAMVLLALGSAGLVVGLLIGNRLRIVVSGARVHPADRAAGGLASCAGIVLIVWLLVPVMADVSEWPAQQARGSRLAALVAAVLPEPPDSVQALGRVVGETNFPRVLDALQATPEVVDPPSEVDLAPEVVAEVAASVVKVEGVACRRIQLGTGFVIDDDLVLTNAHVIAGEPHTTVLRDDGVELNAVAVLFDPERDLAVLHVEGLDRSAIPLHPGEAGDTGGVFGFPAGGDLRVAPFEIARHLTATGRDIYGRTRVSREVFAVATLLESGDSGAPIIDPSGAALGMAFAIAPDRQAVAYALTAAEIDAALQADMSQPVDTGECLW